MKGGEKMSTDVNVISLSSQTDSNTKTASAVNSSPAVKSTKKDCSTDKTLPDKGKKSFDDVLETAKESKKADTTESKTENKEVKTTADKTAGISIATELAAAMQQSAVTNTDAVKSDGKTVLVENPVVSALLKAEASITGTTAASSATAMPVTSGQKQSAAVQTEQTGISSGSNTQSSIQKVVQQNVQGSLDALLPQNENTASAVNANQQLMQMLSSKNSGLATLQQTVAPAVSAVQDTSRQVTAESSVVGSTVMAAIQQPILQENTALQPTTGKQNTAVSKKGTDAAKTAVLGGQSIQVTVEDHTNLLGQMQQKGQQLQHQTLQNAVSEQPVVTAVSAARVQLPEEAVGDTEATSTTKVDPLTTSSSQQFVTAFQQSLQPIDGTTTQTAASAPQAAASYDIPGQIVDQAKLIKSTEGTEMVIKLKPEYLGDLTLKISVTADGAVNASFHSDNAQVRNIIETSMVQLRQDLQAQGLKVDNVGVYAGLSDGFFANSQSNQPRQQQKPSTRNQKIDLVDFEDTANTLSAVVNNSLADDGVDYRV
jgi:flagellar hook-length control protein FliK